jgi:DNA-directed RNA polymerase II subunit RPB3
MSQIEVTTLTSDVCEFTLRNSTLSIASALRRILIADVPTLAIDEVYIYDNNSVMFDEFLSHRLGLVPLVSEEVDRFINTSECTCAQGCDKCCVSFKLDVSNSSDQIKLVTIRDLEPYPNPQPLNDSDQQSAIRTVVPVRTESVVPNHNAEHDIVLCKLAQDHRIQLLCKARKGTGKQHSKWSPVCTAVFEHQPIVKIKSASLSSLDRATQQSICDSCPTQVFMMSDVLDIEDQDRCMFCNECVKAYTKAGKPDLITIDSDPTVFRFSVETTGSMRPENLVKKAIDVLRKKLLSVRV